MNVLSAPWPGRGDRCPARSRAARASRPAQAGGKKGGEARSQRPGAAGEAPAELSAEGGGASPRILRLRLLRRRGRRGPSRSPGDDKSRLAMGARSGKRGYASSRPSPDEETPGSCAAPSACARPECNRDTRPPSPAGRPEGSHFQLRPHPAAPSLARRLGNPRLFLCVRGTRDVPVPLQGQWRGSSLSLPRPPQASGTQNPEECRKGQRAPYQEDRRVQVSSWRDAAPVRGPRNSSRGVVCG